MKFFYSLLLFVLPVTTFAQSNFFSGFVIKNNGDTVKGYIDNREWEKSPRMIDFKRNKSDNQVIQFTPATIKAFKIDGMEDYITYTGYISTDKTTFPDLPNGLDTAKRLDTIFLKTLTTGKHLTLYYNSDDIKNRFFIAEGRAEPAELKYHEFYTDINTTGSSAIYKGQLILEADKYAAGNNNILRKINDAGYNEDDLQAIVNRINGDFNKKETKVSRFYVGFALNYTNTQEQNVFNENAIKTVNALSPKINFGVDLFNNPVVQKLIFRADVSLSYITPKFNFPVGVSGASINNVYGFNQYSATITPQGIYNIYNKEKIKFYLDFGWAFNFSAYTDNKVTLQQTNGNTSSINKPYILQSYWSNFPAQVGVVLNKKLEFSVTYNSYAAFTKYTNLSISTQSVNLGFKYLLK